MDREGLKSQIVIRGGWSTSETVTEGNLNDLISRAHRWAAGYKKWPFTEGKVTTTYVSTTEDYSYPEGWKSDSIRLLQLGDKRVQKLVWSEYQSFKEDLPDSSDRVYSDFGGRYYINPSIDLSGTITVWGQFTPPVLVEADTTVFEGEDDEGDEAVIEKTMAFVYERIGELKNAQARDEIARKRLDELWTRITDEGFGYHTGRNAEGMFKRIDAVKGAIRDDLLKRDQFGI